MITNTEDTAPATSPTTAADVISREAAVQVAIDYADEREGRLRETASPANRSAYLVEQSAACDIAALLRSLPAIQSTPTAIAIEDAAAAAAEEWFDEAHSAFKTNRARIATLASIIIRHMSTAQSDGVAIIAAERQRQVTEEGWTPEHDDEHTDDSLAHAAAAYAIGGGSLQGLLDDRAINIWPTSWGAEEDAVKSKSRLRQLAIAGALIAAEIDRIKRSAALTNQGDKEK